MKQELHYCGIDPGLDGAVAIIRSDGIVMHDTPVIFTGKKREYDAQAMAGLIPRNSIVGVELVHSMPKQGVTSSFCFGFGFGLWIGILAALGVRYEFVTPQRWKKVMLDGMPKEKGSSILAAKRMFPSIECDLRLVKHHGRADALLIAAYTRKYR